MLGTNEHMKMPKGRKQTPHSQGAPRLVWGDRHEQIRGGDAEHIRWCKRNGGNRAEVPRVVREGLLERATPEPSPGGEGACSFENQQVLRGRCMYWCLQGGALQVGLGSTRRQVWLEPERGGGGKWGHSCERGREGRPLRAPGHSHFDFV